MKRILTILSLLFSLYSVTLNAKDASSERQEILVVNENFEDSTVWSSKIEALQNQIDSLNVLVSTKTEKPKRFSIGGYGESAREDLGRELHRVSRTKRCESVQVIGSYIGLQLSVRNEYNIAGTFERNIFFVKGMTRLKYRCGTSVSLPQGFVESSYYPERT